MKWIETTQKHHKKYRLRFRYFEYSNGKGSTYCRRVTRTWWKPFVFIGNKILIKLPRKYDKLSWFIRNNLTYQ